MFGHFSKNSSVLVEQGFPRGRNVEVCFEAQDSKEQTVQYLAGLGGIKHSRIFCEADTVYLVV